MNPFHLFDRPRTTHAWSRALHELDQAEVTWRTIGENWRMDWRVSEAREDDLLAAPEWAGDLDGESWGVGVRNYYRRAMCQPHDPQDPGPYSFYLAPVNRSNALPPAMPPPHEQLIHVASLNVLLGRLSTAKAIDVDLKLRFPTLPWPLRRPGATSPAVDGASVDELVAALLALDSAEVREIAGAISDALGPREPPWWAGFAEEALTFVKDDDWTDLCRALGIGHLDEGDWLLMWRYDVGVVHSEFPRVGLYRPTVVEAGANPYHHPSPPAADFGITMVLSTERHGALREVIHPPLKGDASAAACTGQLGRVKTAPVGGYDKISGFRAAHRRKLVSEFFEPTTEDWLARHS